jgi:5-oxoprolinase (ATP-hydrolysing)
LERKGEKTLLVTTQGCRDVLRIAYQNRPDIFAREIVRPEALYTRVVEVVERIGVQGDILVRLNQDKVRSELVAAFNEGFRSLAVCCMHGYRFPEHERQIGEIAEEIGFSQISLSHKVSPLIKIVSRGDTTVVDAYLSPVLFRYVQLVQQELPGVPLLFMQSNGGLIPAEQFCGKDSILSGPAGGVVGAVAVSEQNGASSVVGFDMGGTSTDVSHYAGELERCFDAEVAGARLRVPMLEIHTVAAGGGSILQFKGGRFQVGPESAGAFPGPACYGNGGPLTVTDANLLLGRVQSEYFPAVFGRSGKEPLDRGIVVKKFSELAQVIADATGQTLSVEEIASGFLQVANENMAHAVRHITLARGIDLEGYTLTSFGGAGGQHACAVAGELSINQILLHPLAGVLSAAGIGLSDIRFWKQQSVERALDEITQETLREMRSELERLIESERKQSSKRSDTSLYLHLRYEGTDYSLVVPGEAGSARSYFEEEHRRMYGFTLSRPVTLESVSVEVIERSEAPESLIPEEADGCLSNAAGVRVYTAMGWEEIALFPREALAVGMTRPGPLLVIEKTGTLFIDHGWELFVQEDRTILLSRVEGKDFGADEEAVIDRCDPIRLELFHNAFQAIADQMGVTLKNTSLSVNIKERLDFSCAIFNRRGDLIANAPHVPVHLGSMDESVKTVIARVGETLRPGDAYMLNNPYDGGTHLPDVTVVRPVFDAAGNGVRFFVASRAHHADVGGITPGSMPPFSSSIEEEGVFLDLVKISDGGGFLEGVVRESFVSGRYPARNIEQNVADLLAQVAANQTGARELERIVDRYGYTTVSAYMDYMLDNAERCVEEALIRLESGSRELEFDSGAKISVRVDVDKERRRATVDFSGTSEQQSTNFNAPRAVTRAAVLYVFRTLLDEQIPLNSGCLRPITITIPEGSMLSPVHPAAVVAGNVEVSQAVVDALFLALKQMAGAQGTMNNFTFGNEEYQYYETLCGGAPAGPGFHGANAVHTHMTNSRLTDPEVLEHRYPVLLRSCRIREGSGGDGKFRGGNGIERCIEFLEPMTASIVSGRRRVPPAGLLGGECGACGENSIERADGSVELLDGCAQVELGIGDKFVIKTPGGGGVGHCGREKATHRSYSD